MRPFDRSNLESFLKGKKVLVGITGSIAAFKTTDLVRHLKEVGAEVKVVLTHSASRFVTALTLETLSGNAVESDLWETEGEGTHHIDLARWADVAIVTPATANFIAKLACGLADDLLSTELLAFKGPLAVAPAMNPAMYEHPAVQTNLQKLRQRGAHLIGPEAGEMACGEVGLGRLVEPLGQIVELSSLFEEPLIGKRALITLGPTVSHWDPVRYLTNRSSGKMGVSLCWEAKRRGYEVVAIAGPIEPALLPSGVKLISVQTAKEMMTEVKKQWKSCDLYLGCAAVLDWEFKSETKKQKKKRGLSPNIELEENPDILKWISKNRRGTQTVIGFAAETEDLLENARNKLRAKNLDGIFVNEAKGAFDSDLNRGYWISPSSQAPVAIGPAQKIEVAKEIFSQLESVNRGLRIEDKKKDHSNEHLQLV